MGTKVYRYSPFTALKAVIEGGTLPGLKEGDSIEFPDKEMVLSYDAYDPDDPDWFYWIVNWSEKDEKVFDRLDDALNYIGVPQ